MAGREKREEMQVADGTSELHVFDDNNECMYCHYKFEIPEEKVEEIVPEETLEPTPKQTVKSTPKPKVEATKQSEIPEVATKKEWDPPAALEAAKLAQHIYNEIPIITYGTKKEISDNIDARTVGDWTQVAVYCGKESLKMGIYVRKGEDINNASGYVIVFRGTNPTDLTCWENDIEAWNRSMDYYSIDLWEAIQNSKKFVESHPQDVIFIGHSKGGGEAIAAASATGKDAITFNAANFDFYDYGVVPKNTVGINNYYIKGEWLSGIIKPARYGTTHWIDTRNSSYIPGTNILIYKEPEFSNSFEKHAIELMINQLQVRGY